MRRRHYVLSAVLLVFTLVIQFGLQMPPGFGASWSPKEKVTDDANLDQHPSVAEGFDGRVWFVWQSYRNFNLDVFLRKFDLATGVWFPQTQVTFGPYQDGGPSIIRLLNGSMMISFVSNRTGDFELYYKIYRPSSTSPDRRITFHPGDDATPSAVAAKDGKIWVFWSRDGSDVYYKFHDGTGWSPDTRLTISSEADRLSAAFQTKDGRIWVVWTRFFAASHNSEIFYQVYQNGAWGSEVQLTNNPNLDANPTISQDRDGVIWVVWNREYSAGAGTFQDELQYVTSADNGVTWTPEALLTDDRTSIPVNDREPALSQISDKNLWLAWSRDDGDIFDIWIMKFGPVTTHDVSVRAVSAPSKFTRGLTVLVNVTVSNLGDFNETFTVTVSARNTTTITIGSRTVTLSPGASVFLSFSWDTSTVTPAKYEVSSTIPAVPGETTVNQADNTLVDGRSHILPPGDVDRDGDVDIRDGVLWGLAFGSTPSSPVWNPNADVNGDGRIDVADGLIISVWFDTKT